MKYSNLTGKIRKKIILKLKDTIWEEICIIIMEYTAKMDKLFII
ncbi:hypothetical protein [Clostridium perfringens]|nr:hypothetical protein [Clostridium perfringens]MDK0730667.1 hypothetical protein [Clostridium perfringens]MDM0594471.1 hypothetical protein [Clostridium perfringens]MDM0597531.1 hypothetical protein [Clostridium perfringens]MDM0733953.1 hypothetical protein [Clostridium perfringens]MDM0754293.1 hypothetical protein [Clostridium perfringens]